MAGPIATLRVMLSADDAELRKGLGRSDKASKKWAAAQKRRNAETAKSFKTIGLAVVALGASYAALTKRAVEHADTLAKQARTIGVTVEVLQEYTFAAERSGVSTSEMVKGLQQFNKFLGQAARGVGTAKTAFEDLGIAIKDSEGNLRSQEVLIEEFVDALSKIENPMMRAGLASDVFGRAGVKLLPMMAGGVEGLDALRAAAHELGVVMEGETALKAEILNDKLGTLSETISTRMNSALVNFASDNTIAIAKGIDLIEALGLSIMAGAQTIHSVVSGILGAIVKMAAGIVAAFTSLGRAIGRGIAHFVTGAKKLVVEAQLMAQRFTLGLLNGYNKVINTANPAALKLLSFFGLTDANTSDTAANISRLENESRRLGEAMVAGWSMSISGEDNPVFQTMNSIGDVLIHQAGTSGTAAGQSFKDAWSAVVNGGTASGVNAGIDELAPTTAAGTEQTGDGIDEANAQILKQQEQQMAYEKKLVDTRRNTMQMTLGFLQQQVKGGSAAAKVIMGMSTALNVAQIISNTHVAVMRTMAELGPVAGPPMAAAIQTQGMVSAGIAAAQGIQGMFHDGIDHVPSTGTYLLEEGERVVDKRLNADLKAALNGGQSAGVGGGNTLSINVNGVSDAETINRIVTEQRPQFEQMFREINQDRAGQGLL
jgi:hypothetical protein